jgi:hypothetical protein
MDSGGNERHPGDHLGLSFEVIDWQQAGAHDGPPGGS